MFGQLLEMPLLLGELLLELEQLLALALADGVVLAGLLAPLESVTGDGMSARCIVCVSRSSPIPRRPRRLFRKAGLLDSFCLRPRWIGGSSRGREGGGGTDRGREKKGEIRKKEKKNSPLATHLRRRAGVAVGHGAAGRREGTARGRTRDPPQGGGLGEGLAEHCVSLDLDDYMSIDLKGIFLKKKSKSKRDYIGKSQEEGGAETSRIRRKKLRLLLTFDR